VSLLFLIGLAACGPAQIPPAPPVEGGPAHLVVVHTNDLHAHFSPNRAGWLPGEPDIGGFAEISAHIAALERAHGADEVLVLDGGDILTGTPLMEFEARGAQGGAMLDFMEGAGFDAWVLGNHEFDLGYGNISALVGASKIPVLSANLDASDGSGAPGIAGLQDHTIFERSGIRIGVFGLTTDGLAHLTSGTATENMTVRDVAEVAKEQVALLEPQVDLVIALTHIGLESDQALAEEVPGIDLIVGGHSHTPLYKPVKVGETWIVQAGSYARHLGVAEMTIEDGRITGFRGVLRDLVPGAAEAPPSPAVVELQERWLGIVSERFDTPVGAVTATLGRKPIHESPLGRWSADMVQAFADSQIGIYNPGGLRSDLVAGPLTRRGLYEVFPFSNTVVRFEMSGEELIGLLLRNANAELEGKRSAMQLSGVVCKWRVRSGAPEIIEARVGGALVKPESSYSAATNSYVIDRWSYNLGFEPRETEVLDGTVFVAAQAMAAKGPIVPPPNPRMVRVD
jgi:2',3'-cyclic-nucleotide 2'-phosphodiesterase (5'-nucleotidase family)